MSSKLILAFSLLINLLSFGHVTYAQTRGGEREDLQLEEEFGENDYFEIYFIQSFPKSMTVAYDNSFTLQTSGLLIRDVKSFEVITLEFLPANWEQCFFPSIQVLDDNSAGHITWDMSGKLVKRTSFEVTDYEHALYLGTMNGVVRSTFLQWVKEQYIMKKQSFFPQSICMYRSGTATFTPDKDTDDVSCLVTHRNWDTFVEKSLQILSKYDVKMSSLMPIQGKKLVIECASLSDKLLYHSKLPLYYQSLYACMAGNATLKLSISFVFQCDVM